MRAHTPRFAVCFAIALVSCTTASKPPTLTTGSGAPGQGGASGGDAGTSTCAFASTPTAFTLPVIAGAPASPFVSLGAQEACAAGTGPLAYTVADVNGDGRPDLVLRSSCTDPTVGVSTWLVYLNTGTGFATTATRFALPPSSASGGCSGSSFVSSILDINGDAIPDYVVTSLCNDATVGTSRWLVYSGTAAGFAQTAVPYALPSGYSAGSFTSMDVAKPSCTGAANSPAFSFFDITGDAKPDFVLTQVCSDASIGTTAWLVFEGTSSGASGPGRFALPTAPAVTAGAFASVAGALSCTSSVTVPAFSLLDMNLDGKIDLVVTGACNDTNVGTNQWLWYENSGSAFASSPTTQGFPTLTGAPTNSFATLSADAKCTNGAGAPGYALADIDGDSVLDLIVTRDCSDAMTGVAYWDVYPSTGAAFASKKMLRLPAELGATSNSPVGLSGTLDCSSPATLAAFSPEFLTGQSLGLIVTQACSDSTVGASRWLWFPASCP